MAQTVNQGFMNKGSYNQFGQQLQTSDNVEPVVVQDNKTTERLDGNNVDIETEMVNLAKNSIEYYTMVQKLNAEFKKMKTAINLS